MARKSTHGFLRGQNHGRAKLSDHEVELLRQMVERGELTQKEAAEKFELNKGYVSRLISYKRRLQNAA